MNDPLHCLIEPGSPDAPVILLLHGRGSDERDLLPLGRELHESATIVSVRAPHPGAPWGYGGGWAWYRFQGGTTPEPASFEFGQRALEAFIAGELPSRLGRAINRLVIGGFSQGGTSSLAYVLRNPGIASAVIVFSGFLPEHPSVSADAIGTTPVWWGHGTADPAITFEKAERGWLALKSAGADLTTLTREGMGHTIDRTTTQGARDWLAQHVGPNLQK